jgi:RimJ/RimL family protein N-acetyltransferase
MIKKLDKNHWLELKEIRLEALQKSPDSFLSSFEEENQSADNVWIEKLENSSLFGYFFNEKIIAFCQLKFEKAKKISHIATLSSMFVKDEKRGEGIGLELVNFVKDFAKNNGAKHLYLGCNSQNLSGIKLYKKCGFKVYGTRPNYTKIDNKFYDDLIMMCEL